MTINARGNARGRLGLWFKCAVIFILLHWTLLFLIRQMSGPPHIALSVLVGMPFFLIFTLVHTLHIPIDSAAGGVILALLAVIVPTMIYGSLGALVGWMFERVSRKKDGNGA